MREPLPEQEAKRLIRKILDSGCIRFSRHALAELAKDRLTTVDCVNVLRAGVVEPAEREMGSWRYRVRTHRMYVVVVFRTTESLVVVTAWRTQR